MVAGVVQLVTTGSLSFEAKALELFLKMLEFFPQTLEFFPKHWSYEDFESDV